MTKTPLEIYKEGSIDVLFNRGIITGDVLLYFKYFAFYEQERNNGKTYREAVLLTSIYFEVSESTVKRAVRCIR